MLASALCQSASIFASERRVIRPFWSLTPAGAVTSNPSLLASPQPATNTAATIAATARRSAPVAFLGPHELLGQRRARWRGRVSAHRHGLGHRARELRGALAEVDRHLLAVDPADDAVGPRLHSRVLKVVQQVLGLVLEAQDRHLRPVLDIGQRD